MPGPEILVHHQKIGFVGGRLFCALELGQIVVCVTDISARIDAADQIAHHAKILDAAGSAGGAFIGYAPGKYARMVSGLLDHFLHLPPRERLHCRISIAAPRRIATPGFPG